MKDRPETAPATKEEQRLRHTLVDIAVAAASITEMATEALWGDRRGEVPPDGVDLNGKPTWQGEPHPPPKTPEPSAERGSDEPPSEVRLPPLADRVSGESAVLRPAEVPYKDIDWCRKRADLPGLHQEARDAILWLCDHFEANRLLLKSALEDRRESAQPKPPLVDLENAREACRRLVNVAFKNRDEDGELIRPRFSIPREKNDDDALLMSALDELAEWRAGHSSCDPKGGGA